MSSSGLEIPQCVIEIDRLVLTAAADDLNLFDALNYPRNDECERIALKIDRKWFDVYTSLKYLRSQGLIGNSGANPEAIKNYQGGKPGGVYNMIDALEKMGGVRGEVQPVRMSGLEKTVMNEVVNRATDDYILRRNETNDPITASQALNIADPLLKCLVILGNIMSEAEGSRKAWWTSRIKEGVEVFEKTIADCNREFDRSDLATIATALFSDLRGIQEGYFDRLQSLKKDHLPVPDVHHLLPPGFQPARPDGDWIINHDGRFAFEAVVTQLCNIKPEVLTWLWPKKVPAATVTIFAGPPGVGKSLTALDFAGRGSIGRDFLDGSSCVQHFKSLLLMAEDDKGTVIIPRLMAMGADLSKISSVDMVRWKGVGEESETGTRFISLETDLNTIRAKIVSDPAIKLVIIDPISNYMEKKSMNSDQEFRSILMPVVTMAQETGVSVIVIMHNSKQLGRDALGKIGGSLGGVGTARIAWTFMKKDGTEEYEMLLMKKNLGKFEGIRYTTESVDVVINGQTTSQAGMKFLGMSKGDADVAMAEADNFEAKRENAAAALIRTMLPSGGKVLVNDLFTAADNKGIAKRTMQKAISDLQLKSTGSKKHGLYYEWPESETPTASITGDPTVPF